MPVSPKTLAMMQPPPTAEEAETAFEQGFAQLAQRIFTAKYPDLADLVVTFKILRTNMDEGSGIGAFILDVSGTTVFVPVVLADNQLKPLELMYVKDEDLFVPFSKDWIEEVAHKSTSELGKKVIPPDMLPVNPSVREAVTPPTYGRFSFAAEKMPGTKLAHFLSQAPNFVKKAFISVLENNHEILKYAFENFDKDMLLESLQPVPEKIDEPKYAFLTPESTKEEFFRWFGKNAGEAWQTAVKQGYVVADQRKKTNRPVLEEKELKFGTPDETGFYSVVKQDGSLVNALVIVNPQPLDQFFKAMRRTDQKKYEDPYKIRVKKRTSNLLVGESAYPMRDVDDISQTEYLVYTEDGEWIETTDGIIAQHSFSNPELLSKISNSVKGAPRPGLGFFLSLRDGKPRGTEVVNIDTITTGSDGVRRIKLFNGKELVTDPKYPVHKIIAPAGSNLAFLPEDYKFIPLEKGKELKLLLGQEAGLDFLKMLKKAGALKAHIVDAGMGMYSIAGLPSQDKFAAVQSLVSDLGFTADDAEMLLKEASVDGKVRFYVVNDAVLEKLAHLKEAQGMPPGAMPPEAMAGAMPPGAMPPGAMPPGAMPPEAMAGAMAPTTPMDAAAQALQQQQMALQQQADALQQQQMALAQQQQALQEAAQTSEKLQEPEIFEATAIGSLAHMGNLKALMAEYLPVFESALDKLGRLLFSMWVQEKELIEEIGDEPYTKLEGKMLSVFRNLSGLVIKAYKTALPRTEGEEATGS